MAQFTRLAAAIAAASLAGAVHAAPTVEFSGEVAFAAEYSDADTNNNGAGGSASKVELDTAELSVKATEGAVTAGLTMEADGTDITLDNAFIEYKINANYTAFAKQDDTQAGFALNSAIWSDVLAEDLVDYDATAAGVKIQGGPISSTIYLTNGANGEDDLQEFGTSVDFAHDMFNAHFGFISSANGTGGQGAFSLGADASVEDFTFIIEYNWLSDTVTGTTGTKYDPTYLHLEADYEMEGYVFALAFDTTDEANEIGDAVEQQIAVAVTKDITDFLWAQGEIALKEGYTANSDETVATLVVGASF
jgi:hypothetical protein